MTGYTQAQIEQMKKDDMRYFLHPTSSITDMVSWGGPKIIEEGNGIRIKNVEGKTFIYCGAGLWLNNIGYGRTEVAEVA